MIRLPKLRLVRRTQQGELSFQTAQAASYQSGSDYSGNKQSAHHPAYRERQAGNP